MQSNSTAVPDVFDSARSGAGRRRSRGGRPEPDCRRRGGLCRRDTTCRQRRLFVRYTCSAGSPGGAAGRNSSCPVGYRTLDLPRLTRLGSSAWRRRRARPADDDAWRAADRADRTGAAGVFGDPRSWRRRRWRRAPSTFSLTSSRVEGIGGAAERGAGAGDRASTRACAAKAASAASRAGPASGRSAGTDEAGADASGPGPSRLSGGGCRRQGGRCSPHLRRRMEAREPAAALARAPARAWARTGGGDWARIGRRHRRRTVSARERHHAACDPARSQTGLHRGSPAPRRVGRRGPRDCRPQRRQRRRSQGTPGASGRVERESRLRGTTVAILASPPFRGAGRCHRGSGGGVQAQMTEFLILVTVVSVALRSAWPSSLRACCERIASVRTHG